MQVDAEIEPVTSRVSWPPRSPGTSPGRRCAPTTVGRAHETRQLTEALDRAVPGRLTVAVVVGPPGSGKSHLIEEFTDAARRAGHPVTPLACWAGRDRTRRAAGTPAQLVVAEYPDPIEPRTWAAVAAMAATAPVLAVLTRPPEVSWPGTRLLGPTGMTRIALAPLTDEAVSELVTRLLGALPDTDLLALAAVAAGNPGALVEFVTGLREEQLVIVHGGKARLRTCRLPARTRARIAGSLATLSAPARHLLQVASTGGSTFGLLDVADAMRRGAATLLPAIDEAMASGLVVGVGEHLAFSHDEVRRIVEASLPRPVAVALRRDRLATPGGTAADLDTLNEQERQIAHLVGRAMTNQQIAHRIGRSPHTVNYHLRQIFRKLNLTSRVELAALAALAALVRDSAAAARVLVSSSGSRHP
ncbi:LuxR C-terminal-related transcriptional regulator [Solwaraspora sp. WMMB335]|uniref:helix-turn-helix transcriptional regulator n=1 Tax=Solwaraspora sp. WMMB335 TaxID=3404118 RepID=UPI003B92AB1C